MSFLDHLNVPKDDRRQAIVNAYYMDEADCIETLLEKLDFNDSDERTISSLARELVVSVRAGETKKGGMEAFMAHYDLSTEEGIMLMCLAEALLRVPDSKTEDMLIRDKLTSADWAKHIGLSQSSFVNMATWGLALTGNVLKKDHKANYFNKMWKSMIRKSGEPVVRKAVRDAVKIMSKQFVLGRTIEEALKLSQSHLKDGFSYSYDMLGEAARTQADADEYYKAYSDAIDVIGKSDRTHDDIGSRPAISVKLSALYPRYEFTHQVEAIPFLTERLKSLLLKAKHYNICLNVDAEEVDRLDISLDIIENVFIDPEFKDYDGLGLAVQAYQKRAYAVIEWVADLARRQQKKMRVRLVKGAYWDSEIKLAQEHGFPNYALFTRKTSTDVSYLACAKLLLQSHEVIYPQFATHNAYTVAAILTMVKQLQEKVHFEFQHLQGMGETLHREILRSHDINVPSRIYAPVGSHEDLLPYLVRRLLENGANSSFVNQIADEDVPIEKLTASPVEKTAKLKIIPNPKIPLPVNIYGKARRNSQGFDVSDYIALEKLDEVFEDNKDKQYSAAPMGRALNKNKTLYTSLNPANHHDVVGHIEEATLDDVDMALTKAQQACIAWDALGATKRADILDKAADLLEMHRFALMSLTQREAGKTLNDCISEVREAVDFCRYYAKQARVGLRPRHLKGYTGETNTLTMQGRGVMLCISPWNFPVAIFVGQITAALVAGNGVIAKPAETTTLIANEVVTLLHQAGVPKEVLQLMPGPGSVIGNALVKDERINGVIFTGSTQTAKHIQRSLAERDGPIVPLIAETGGINAMIVDSTALPEQLIDDAVLSAFGSAGQRCSALRVMFVQEDIADRVITMLAGAMQDLYVGNPNQLHTDMGPVIDAAAHKTLMSHINQMKQDAKLIYETKLPAQLKRDATFVPACAFELESLAQLQKEVFGPVLHVIRYAKKDLDSVIDQINALNFGLTFGIQSRINEMVEYVAARIKAGNIYVNRNIIGAIVGVQPFGGSRLSGTGPKAGGPHYVPRLCAEQVITINTTAAGGNATLMSLNDE